MESHTLTADAPYMKSLAACLNRMVKEGYVEDYKPSGLGLTSGNNAKHYLPKDIQIVNFFRFEGNAYPEDNAIMYIIETNDGGKGILVDTYGPYADPRISQVIKEVEELKRNKIA